MKKSLRGKVVVITGASSGIGRAAAILFAERGASVVLAARSEETLAEVVAACERLGAGAIAVPTDVGDADAVRALAQEAVTRFGRIDVWVNDAGVSMIGTIEQTPPEAYRRLIEINVLGVMHGATAVLPYFRAQGEGVIINVSSILGVVGSAYVGAYAASKAAIRVFSQALREELRGTKIRVSTLLPPMVDTPIFQHSANFTGRVVEPVPPNYPTERLARAIVRLAERPAAERSVGLVGYAVTLGGQLLPGLAVPVMSRVFGIRAIQRQEAPPTNGNLFEAMPSLDRISGGWPQRFREERLERLASLADGVRRELAKLFGRQA